MVTKQDGSIEPKVDFILRCQYLIVCLKIHHVNNIKSGIHALLEKLATSVCNEDLRMTSRSAGQMVLPVHIPHLDTVYGTIGPF